MHSKGDNVEIMIGIKTDDIINELFKSFSEKYQNGLEKKKWKEVILFLKVLIYYFIVFIK